MKNRLPLIGQGTVGALIGSLCCLLPAAAIAIGLTGGITATLVNLGRFRLYGIIAGLAFIAIASLISIRRSRSCCTEEEYKRRKLTIPLIMLVSFGAERRYEHRHSKIEETIIRPSESFSATPD